MNIVPLTWQYGNRFSNAVPNVKIAVPCMQPLFDLLYRSLLVGSIIPLSVQVNKFLCILQPDLVQSKALQGGYPNLKQHYHPECMCNPFFCQVKIGKAVVWDQLGSILQGEISTFAQEIIQH